VFLYQKGGLRGGANQYPFGGHPVNQFSTNQRVGATTPDKVHKTARNKPRHVSSIYGVMGRGVWQPYVSHHQPQKSADLTMQSGAN